MYHSRSDSSDQNPKTLVIGIGNDFRGDDGVGLYVARKLKGMMPKNVEIIEVLGEATELMGLWENEESVIIIDAVSSRGNPGIIHRYDLEKESLSASHFDSQSTHAFGLVQAIELAKTFGTLPKSLVVYGVEGINFEMGSGLSSQIEKAAQEVIRRILAEIA